MFFWILAFFILLFVAINFKTKNFDDIHDFSSKPKKDESHTRQIILSSFEYFIFQRNSNLNQIIIYAFRH
jgi:hypothetical protein